MALTPSNMLALGTIAPNFDLPDTVSGTNKTLDDIASDQGTLVMFICNHCPYVKHINKELARLSADYQPLGISMVAISSNDVDHYPQDGPESMKQLALEEGYGFPYLYDETQDVARAYDAACTPDFYLFNGARALVYRGQLDDSRPGSGQPVTGSDLRKALDQLLAGTEVFQDQTPSVGCNIKWKS